MKAYYDRILNILEAEEEISDEEAFTASLDKETNPEDFDTTAEAPAAAPTGPDPKEVLRTQQMSSLQSWVGQITEFISFLNGLDTDSVQKQLNDAECDTLFADIARGETKRIARLAQELSGLNESFKGYLLSNEED